MLADYARVTTLRPDSLYGIEGVGPGLTDIPGEVNLPER